MQFIIYLHSEPRSAFLDFNGRSGRPYRFIWSEEHGKMIYLGRPISVEEFKEVAEDIFGATGDQNYCEPIPRIVDPAKKQKAGKLPPIKREPEPTQEKEHEPEPAPPAQETIEV